MKDYKNHISFIVKNIVKFTNIARFVHTSNAKNTISILTYHNIVQHYQGLSDPCYLEVDAFEKQIEYLTKYFKIVPLSDAFKELDTQDKPLAVITFDDGFYSNFSLALPILKKYNVPATIFLTTNLINTEETLWFCKVINALESSQLSQFKWNGQNFDISSKVRKEQTSLKVQAQLKKYDTQLLNKKIIALLNALQVNETSNHQVDRMLSLSNIKAMVQTELIEFGAHTQSHTILSKIPDEEAKEEIEQSVAQVSQWTQLPCKYFAFPNGRHSDFTQYHIDVLKKSNVEYAVSTIHGLADVHDNRYAIKRLFINGLADMRSFKSLIHGF